MLRYGSFMDKPEAPFGLELKVERLMAERKHQGHSANYILISK
jgi:hypothetical protein